jgi:hypothetical protein
MTTRRAFITGLRNWWRGWSDEDLANVLTKIELHKVNPGAIIPVTMRELKAHQAYVHHKYPLFHIDARDLPTPFELDVDRMHR